MAPSTLVLNRPQITQNDIKQHISEKNDCETISFDLITNKSYSCHLNFFNEVYSTTTDVDDEYLYLPIVKQAAYDLVYDLCL